MRGYKRRIIRRIQALILAVLLCIPCLEAKTVDAAPKEKITVMSNIGKETMEPYLEAFEKKYPDICVKYCYYSDYETDMKEKAAEDDLGDVLFVPGCISTDEYSQRFEKLGNYEELADKYYYMEGSKYIEDDVYGIPSSAYLVGILYNKEVFNKAGITETPKSMDDFMQDLYRITSSIMTDNINHSPIDRPCTSAATRNKNGFLSRIKSKLRITLIPVSIHNFITDRISSKHSLFCWKMLNCILTANSYSFNKL